MITLQEATQTLKTTINELADAEQMLIDTACDYEIDYLKHTINELSTAVDELNNEIKMLKSDK
jgi:prefoldin subunit 5